MYRKITFLISISFLFLPGFYSRTEAVPIDKTTEIFVIGTVHVSTPDFNSDTLLNILNKINPDVILIECDTSFMTPDFELKDDIKYAFLETTAITEYQKTKYVQLRPIDIQGGDIFFDDPLRKINESNFFNDIESISESKNENLSSEAIHIIDKFSSMMTIAEEMSNAKVSYINSPEGSIKIDTINYYTYEGLSRLISAVPELSKYKSYWDTEYDNWKKRNKAMFGNILKYKKSFDGKRIIVLCGFAHKNFLKKNLLKKAGAENISVKEFWES